jgi:hypothetical protein
VLLRSTKQMMMMMLHLTTQPARTDMVCETRQTQLP